MEEAGLVELASVYNQYLINNDYSRSIRVGSHEIPVGADYQTMARIITGRS
jgi:hypothetical protein